MVYASRNTDVGEGILPGFHVDRYNGVYAFLLDPQTNGTVLTHKYNHPLIGQCLLVLWGQTGGVEGFFAQGEARKQYARCCVRSMAGDIHDTLLYGRTVVFHLNTQGMKKYLQLLIKTTPLPSWWTKRRNRWKHYWIETRKDSPNISLLHKIL